jgi:hypothetical protein
VDSATLDKWRDKWKMDNRGRELCAACRGIGWGTRLEPGHPYPVKCDVCEGEGMLSEKPIVYSRPASMLRPRRKCIRKNNRKGSGE